MKSKLDKTEREQRQLERNKQRENAKKLREEKRSLLKRINEEITETDRDINELNNKREFKGFMGTIKKFFASSDQIERDDLLVKSIKSLEVAKKMLKIKLTYIEAETSLQKLKDLNHQKFINDAQEHRLNIKKLQTIQTLKNATNLKEDDISPDSKLTKEDQKLLESLRQGKHNQLEEKKNSLQSSPDPENKRTFKDKVAPKIQKLFTSMKKNPEVKNTDNTNIAPPNTPNNKNKGKDKNKTK